MKFTNEERNAIYDDYQRKRLEIGDCLFNTSRHTYIINNAQKMVKLSSELVELATLIERG